MKFTYITIAIFLILLIVAGCIMYYPIWKESNYGIQMDFTGILTDSSGNTTPISVSIDGYLYDDKIDVTLSTPNNGKWNFMPFDSSVSIKHSSGAPYLDDTDYFTAPCMFYDSLKKDMAAGYYALNIEKGLLLICRTSDDAFTIACTVNGDYTPEQIFDHFSSFYRLYGPK